MNLKLKPSSYCLFLSLVFFSLTAFLLWLRTTPLTISFPPALSSAPTSAISASPVTTLNIPDLEISLPIFSGTVTGNRWPVTSKGIIHLSDTPLPGQPGNSVLYGHNWSNLLGNLKSARPGQSIDVRFASGLTQKFVIHQVLIVSPKDSQILRPTPFSRLTLYTCTGFLDSQRLVVTALPQV